MRICLFSLTYDAYFLYERECLPFSIHPVTELDSRLANVSRPNLSHFILIAFPLQADSLLRDEKVRTSQLFHHSSTEKVNKECERQLVESHVALLESECRQMIKEENLEGLNSSAYLMVSYTNHFDRSSSQYLQIELTFSK